MSSVAAIKALHPELIQLRRDIHSHPETAFEEQRTSALVAERLQAWGITVDRSLAKTGVIGTLKGRRPGNQAIALRADMDALHIQERNSFAHRSRHEGKMHACGHDGHTTMLLGAAKHLAANPDFAGTVHFVFQPAEENEGGGRVMVEEGLFDKFPVDMVFGMHNWPDMPAGTFAIRPGPMMAAFDIFEVIIRGKGGHAALPHQAIDPVVMAAQIISALQSIVSRNVHPLDAAVISVTQVHGGDSWNVIPDSVVLRGTARSFKPEVQDAIEPAIQRIISGVTAAYGGSCDLRYERRYPATINHEEATQLALAAARTVVGENQVESNPTPSMGSEDFAFMLQARPGAYIFIGNAPAKGQKPIEGAGLHGMHCMLHNPHYDFNDDILPLGVSYWTELVKTILKS